MDTEQQPVDVSIIVLTYFHEAYVAQALDSILMQETTLQYEILIGDDASQDGTPEILRRYAAEHPDVIRLVLRKENVGANRNSWDLTRQAKGAYIALLEGDDYWSDTHKLQKQRDFLEGELEYIGCCGKCLIVDEHGIADYTKVPHFVWNKKVFALEDLINSWNMPAQMGTMMYRNIFREMPPDTYAIVYRAHPNVGDKTWMLLLLSHGAMYCSNEVLSCYRRVDQSGKHNWFSLHHSNPYRNYDMFMYPCQLESWARKQLHLPHNQHLGKRSEYRFCRFVEECVREPSCKRFQYLAEMVVRSHQPLKYCMVLVKALIEME